MTTEPMDELSRYDEPVEVRSRPEPFCWCYEPRPDGDRCRECGRELNPMDRPCVDCPCIWSHAPGCPNAHDER